MVAFLEGFLERLLMVFQMVFEGFYQVASVPESPAKSVILAEKCYFF